MDDLPLLRRRELTLIVIMSGAIDVLFVGYNILLVIDVVVVVVGGGVHVVRHLRGMSKFVGEDEQEA